MLWFLRRKRRKAIGENFQAELEIDGKKQNKALAALIGVSVMLGIMISTPILAVLDLYFRAKGGEGFYFREGKFFLFDGQSFRKQL